MESSPNKATTTPPRRLILCLDGTWNSADGASITSIVRLRDIIEPGRVALPNGGEIEQRIYYDEGVGTTGTLRRWFDGATGRGLSQNVRQAYRYLAANYRPGDQILIFGFSRGAFTARSVAGYIGASGLLKPENCDAQSEQRAWDYYRTPPKDRYPREGQALDALSQPKVRISALGVFDTVGSLGIPSGLFRSWSQARFQFHDTTLGSNIDIALHALAADEKRYSFGPALWQLPQHRNYRHVEQVWFPGVHSDVGGGYSDDGIGRLALDWMLKRIHDLGVPLGVDVQLRPGADWVRRSTRADGAATPRESRTALFFWDRVRPSIRVIAQRRPRIARRERVCSLPQHARPIGEYVHVALLEQTFAAAKAAGRANVRQPLDVMAGGHPAPLGLVTWSGRPLLWGRNPDPGDRKELYTTVPADLHSRLDAFLAARWKDGLEEPDPLVPF